MKKLTRTMVAALLAVPLMPGIASAYELVMPTLDYRTGPYAPNGIPFANGYGDYLSMLNERDGGIKGARISLVPCETGYNT
ncbi:MAG: ABC transporter substrate-binding protein, partial [Gammaproteobacteria bacterium]|nr:ABC transporter substrate-binding protein [Gammaproteobacteria bacterium]